MGFGPDDQHDFIFFVNFINDPIFLVESIRVETIEIAFERFPKIRIYRNVILQQLLQLKLLLHGQFLDILLSFF